jgi:pimeloyl-ACP methyl ester carboxylesterase
VISASTVRLPSGIELAVRTAGSGPLVILMHGWPELGLAYRHQMEPLAAAGFTAVAPDMRGFGGSAKPSEISAYTCDNHADDMAGLAEALGGGRWVAVGHDHGSPVAWRSALRFPEEVAAVFSYSVPHSAQSTSGGSLLDRFDQAYPDRFFYIRYFQQVGPPEAELEADVRAGLKKVYWALSGDAPLGEWTRERPYDDPLLPGLGDPPPGPLSFMPDDVMEEYVAAFSAGGFRGPISWYRNIETNARDAEAYGEQRITQPAGFLWSEKDIVKVMSPPNALETQRGLCDDLRVEIELPDAGHWIQQERPQESTDALLSFLEGVRDRL